MVEMKRVEAFVKEHHQNKIWFSAGDKRWKTYYNGKLVANKTENGLYWKLYDLYQFPEEEVETFHDGIRFGEAFTKWIHYKAQIVSDNTITKYETDYKRLLKDTDFENIRIKKITPDKIEIFLKQTIVKHNLRKKAYSALFDYINATLRYCENNGLIEHNPAQKVEKKYFFRICYDPQTNPKDRVISDEEMNKIADRIHESPENYMVDYAVEFASLTGMRVGEIAALTWKDIDFTNRTILVDKAEVYHVKSRTYTIERTKNESVRLVPMTEKTKDFLIKLKKIEMKYGYLTEWVFSNENGKIHKIAIGRCASNRSLQAGLSKPKGMHARRRTLNSKIRNSGISASVASAILGHSEEVNQNNYTYDVSDLAEKKSIMEAVGV